MHIGERIKQARLEAGLSQRQLCGQRITRNMLSLIESGKARPGMDTLTFLAAQLGKPIGYFLEEQAALPEREELSQVRLALAQQCVAVLQDMAVKDESWYLLRGQIAFSLGDYARAAEFLKRAERVFPKLCLSVLEQCYRELGDYKAAYEYACKLRMHNA